MIQRGQCLRQRYPHGFRGLRAAIARTLLRGIERWSRLDVIDAFLAANRHVRGSDFGRADGTLRLLTHCGEVLSELPSRLRVLAGEALPRAA